MASDQWYDVELRHLSALEAVAREGSFRKAADALGFVQSAVSQQIAALERAVGKRLVERSRGPGPVRLTEAGELLLGHAQAIRARLKAAQADIGALDSGTLGALRVGITQSVGVRILPQLMQRWAPAWPDVAVRPSESTSDLALYSLVERGELDLAFVELPVPDGPFEAQELLVDPYVLVVAAGSPIARKKGVPTLKEIGSLPLIAHSQCRGLRRVEAQLQARGAEPTVVFRSDVNATVQALVGSRHRRRDRAGARRRSARPAHCREAATWHPAPHACPDVAPGPRARRAGARVRRDRRAGLRGAHSRRPGGADRMSGLRRLSYPLQLVWTRLTHRGERLALVGVGVLAAQPSSRAVLAGSLVMRDRALAQATQQMPIGDRTVQAAWFGAQGIGEGDWRSLDRVARPALRRLNGHEPVSVMLFREAQIHGNLVDLRAVDGLSRWVQLRSGRLPRTCVPTRRCEVVRLDGTGAVPSTKDLRLVEVGTVSLRPDAPFAGFIQRASDTSVIATAVAYHAPVQPPLLIAEGVRQLSQTPELATFFRSYAWIVPVLPGDVHPWAIGRFGDAVDRTRSEIASHSEAFDVTAPVPALRAAAATSRAGAQRLLLLGGEAATLLLAFTILAASSLRRDVEAAWQRLSWYGARRWQLVLFSTGEAAAVAAVATLLGWLVGATGAALIAGRAGSPAGDILRHSVVSGRGVVLAVALATAATLLLFGAMRSPALRLAGFSLSALDVAALGALLAIVVGLTRGHADAASLAAGGGTGTFLLLLPALIAFVAAILTARGLVPLLRAAERLGRRGPVSARLAALSLARNPGHAAVAATFLVVSLGMALFAATYRLTLDRGQTDQAAFAVPADAVLQEDLSQLVTIPQAAGAAQYGKLADRATPVLRLAGDAGRLAGAPSVTLLGIPAAALPKVGGWRSDFSSRSIDGLARSIRPAGDTTMRGVPIPNGAQELELRANVTGTNIAVRAVISSPRGEFAYLRLGATSGRDTRLSVRLPAGVRGGKLVALAFDQLNNGRLTANAGTGLQPVSTGTMRIRSLAVDGSSLDVPWQTWRAGEGAALTGPVVRYQLTTDLVGGIRARQPTDGQPVRALVSPTLAAAANNGLVPVQVEGEPLTVRVAGVVRHFPSVTGSEVVVVDRDTLSTALNTAFPGLGVTNEIWLDGHVDRAALARTPFDVLSVQTRSDLESRLRADPLSRGALLTLAGTALVALLLAIVGLLLGLVSDLRDENGELRDLEAQGATPAQLRRHLRLRTLVVAATGLAGGLLTGLVLSALVTDLVTLTANAGAPEPPLRLVLDGPLVLAGVLGYALLAWATVVLATRAAFRGREVGRVSEAGA